jgi:hypothetical protein
VCVMLEMRTEALVRLLVNYRYYCPILTKSGVYEYIFEELYSIKFHKNPLSCSRKVTCVPTAIFINAPRGCKCA